MKHLHAYLCSLTSSAMLCYIYENKCIQNQNHIPNFEIIAEISMKNRIHITYSQRPVHPNA
jgi:hypothetical protein